MALTLHNLKQAKSAKKPKKRLGRGNSSGLGTYSGRGLKGQKARSGGKGGLKLKGLKGNIQSIPKIGGFKSLKPKLAIVNLKDLEKNFKNDEIITAGKLAKKNLIKDSKSGVKILGDGKLTKVLTVKVNKISESAKKAIEEAGGKVILLNQVKEEQVKEENKKS